MPKSLCCIITSCTLEVETRGRIIIASFCFKLELESCSNSRMIGWFRWFLVQSRNQNKVICEIRTSCLGLYPVGFENLLGQRPYNLSAVGPWFACPHGENLFPLCTSEPVLFELWPIVSYPLCTTAKNLASSLESLPVSTNGLLLSVLKPSFLQAGKTLLPQPPLAGPVLQPPPSWWPSVGLTSTQGSKCWGSMQGVSSPVPPKQR